VGTTGARLFLLVLYNIIEPGIVDCIIYYWFWMDYMVLFTCIPCSTNLGYILYASCALSN